MGEKERDKLSEGQLQTNGEIILPLVVTTTSSIQQQLSLNQQQPDNRSQVVLHQS